MQFTLGMKTNGLIAAGLIVSLPCATPTRSSTTWVDPAAGGNWARTGMFVYRQFSPFRPVRRST